MRNLALVQHLHGVEEANGQVAGLLLGVAGPLGQPLKDVAAPSVNLHDKELVGRVVEVYESDNVVDIVTVLEDADLAVQSVDVAGLETRLVDDLDGEFFVASLVCGDEDSPEAAFGELLADRVGLVEGPWRCPAERRSGSCDLLLLAQEFGRVHHVVVAGTAQSV